MSNPHLYRRFNLLRLGGIPPAKPVGGLVVGAPTKDVRTFQTENPTVAIDGVFLKLVSAEEFDEVGANSRSRWRQILNINNPDIRQTRKR